jgi:hypothetical protein
MPEKLRLDMLNESGEWHILGAFNWDEKLHDFKLTPASFGLDEGEYWLCEFWTGHLRKFSSAKPAVYKKIMPHGGVVCSARLVDDELAAYLGGDLHISQGLEVAEWDETEMGLEFTLRLPRTAEGNIVISVPRPAAQVIVNGELIEPTRVNDQVLQIPLKVEGFAHVEVVYGDKVIEEGES